MSSPLDDGPDWGPTFTEIRRVPGGSQRRLTLEDIRQWQDVTRTRYAADIAVSAGAVDTGDDFDPFGWLADLFSGISTSITENTAAIATLQDIAAATNVTAAYVSDLDDMATVPRAMVVCDAIADSSTKPKYRDVLDFDHVDNSQDVYLHRGVTPTFAPVKVNLVSQGHIYYTPIVVDRTGVVDKLRWIVGADNTLLSINYYEMALCGYDPGSGDLVKIWGSGDIKDGAADSTTLAEVAVSMGIFQECTPGQILFVAHQQTAPSLLQVTRRMACVAQANRNRTVPLLDAACYVAENHSQGIPSSISFASLTREKRFIPWASISVDTEDGS